MKIHTIKEIRIERYTYYWEVEAKNRKEAIKKVNNGEGELIDGQTVHIE
ncbi:hypothetical protein KAR91_12335 [Candidatus Pacearchaeota archaeon]|nr:hypothetical protein [Candidatus Pacearchaeota archaeon]